MGCWDDGLRIFANIIMTTLTKKALIKALQKPAPERIPIGGGGEVNNDFYSVFIIEDGKWSLVKSIKDDTLEVFRYNPDTNMKDIQEFVPISNVKKNNLLVRHYYKGDEYDYKNLLHFAVKGLAFKIDILKTQLSLRWGDYKLKQFKKRKLIVGKRYEILGDLIEMYKSNSANFDIMTFILFKYGDMTLLHDDYDLIEKDLELYFDSFVMEGELTRIGNDEYSLTGKSISSLEKHHSNEEKYKQSMNTQKVIKRLTIIIAVAALFQAGIIKTDPLIDLRELEKITPLKKGNN